MLCSKNLEMSIFVIGGLYSYQEVQNLKPNGLQVHSLWIYLGTMAGGLTRSRAFWTKNLLLEMMSYLRKFWIFFHDSFFGISSGSWASGETTVFGIILVFWYSELHFPLQNWPKKWGKWLWRPKSLLVRCVLGLNGVPQKSWESQL